MFGLKDSQPCLVLKRGHMLIIENQPWVSSRTACATTRECIATQAKKNKGSCKIYIASMKLQFKISTFRVVDPTPFNRSRNWDRMSRRNLPKTLSPCTFVQRLVPCSNGSKSFKVLFHCGAFKLKEQVWKTTSHTTLLQALELNTLLWVRWTEL